MNEGVKSMKQAAVFYDSFQLRLKQFLCRHVYFVVASSDNFQEPTNHNESEEALFYRCEKCLNLRVIRD